MSGLLKIPDFIKEIRDKGEKMTAARYYSGVRAGVLPAIQTGPKAGLRMTMELWKRFKAGEHIDGRYFIKPKEGRAA